MIIKRKFILFLCCLYFCLLAGCTINTNVGNSSEGTTKETDSKTIFDYIFNSGKQKTMYESCASIYISNTSISISDATSISSSDLAATKSLVDTYNVILQTDTIQSQIREEYPEIEYTISLESINETEVFKLIATGEKPEHLVEICNMATDLLCEKIPQIIDGSSSCKVVNYAKSAQLVETN